MLNLLMFASEYLSDEKVMEVSTQALYLILLLSAPMLISALSVGLVISILQATTQIQEQTLSFVPKLIVTFLSCLLCGNWICGMLANFTVNIYSEIGHMGIRE
jgi:flagellar biosynthesis protein FliQ